MPYATHFKKLEKMMHFPSTVKVTGARAGIKQGEAEITLPVRQDFLHAFCVVMLLACWVMAPAPAWAQPVKPGETVTVDGVLALSRSDDDRRLEVVYPAIRLRKPLVLNDGSGDLIEVSLLKLRMNRQQEAVFRRLKGKQAKVSGKLHYFEFGPNQFPNPAHLEVSAMTAR